MKEKIISVIQNGVELEISAIIRPVSSKWLLCLHGLQSNKSLFSDLFEQKFLENYSLLALDLVGFGESSKPENWSYDIQEQAAVCLKVIEKLGIANLHILGHSLGGMVGTLLLEPLGEKVKSFINAEGNFVYADCGLSKTVTADSDFVIYKTSLSIVAWSKSEKLLEQFIKFPRRKLFLYGEQNAWKTASLPTDIPRAKIAGAGHFMLKEKPWECYKVIEGFLDQAV